MTATPHPQSASGQREPDYPGFGSREDIQARMVLLWWIWEQVATGAVKAEPGDHVLATDGRILAVGRDADELFHRVIDTEPTLRNARIVGYNVPARDE